MGQHSRPQHIGIIGGGASGVSCALRLCELGHQVTILEASSFIGGKCTSATVDGRHMDVGGGAGIPGRYDNVKKISDAVGVSTSVVPDVRTISAKDGKNLNLPKGIWKKIAGVWQVCKYICLYYKYGCSNKSGLYRFDPALLSISWEAFAKKHSLTLLEELSRRSIFGFGYGKAKDIHMGYVFNYITPSSLLINLQIWKKDASLYYWEDGTQEVWRRVAEKITKEYGARVYTDSKVTKVVRSETDARVTCTDGASYTFDTLVISSDMQATSQFLNTTPEENALFQHVAYNDYRTYVCKIKNFAGHDQKGITYVWEYIRDYTMNKPVFWSKRYDDLDWYAFYIPVQDASDEQVIDELKTFVQSLGGEVEEIQDIFLWNMFPHVSIETSATYIQDMWNLQGQHHTHYIGEVFSFSLLPCVVDFAFDVAERIDAEYRNNS